MGLSITPEAARTDNGWEFHPTVMTSFVGTAASLSLIPPSFALTDTQFNNIVVKGDDGVTFPFKPSIVFDTFDQNRLLIIPCLNTTGSIVDLKYQLIGWNWSIGAQSWIGTAITHFQTARTGMAVMSAGTGITHPSTGATLYKPMERIGVTTATDADGGVGIIPLPKQYEILPVEGLLSSATTSHASACTIVVKNYGWTKISLHFVVGLSAGASVNVMCMYKRESGVFQ